MDFYTKIVDVNCTPCFQFYNHNLFLKKKKWKRDF